MKNILQATTWYLVGLILFQVVVNIWWLSQNNAQVAWDVASHTWISLSILEKLRSFDFLGVLQVSNYYPIFVHTVTAFILLLAGPQVKIAQFVGSLFFAFTILMLYLYTYTLTKQKSIALLASVIFSLFPIVYGQSRYLMLDLPSTGILLLCLYSLEKSNHFAQRKMTILFVAAVGLLFMTKWTGILFLLLPLCFSVMKTIREKRVAMSLQHITTGIPFFLLLTLPWYLTNLQSILFLSKISLTADGSDPTNFFSWANLLQYLKDFINVQVSPIVALIFLITTIIVLRARIVHAKMLLTSALAGYIIFTIIQNKDPRYTMPLLSFVAIIIAMGLWYIYQKRKWIGTLVITSFLAYLFLYFLILTFRPAFADGFRLQSQLPIIGWTTIINVNNDLVAKYDPQPWPVNETLTSISTDDPSRKVSATVAVEYEHFSSSTLQTYLKAMQLQGIATNLALSAPDPSYVLRNYGQEAFPDEYTLRDYLNQFDFIILAPGTLGTQYLRNAKALEQIQYYLADNVLPSCNVYEAKVAPANTTCFVKYGETLSTGSDVIINDASAAQHGMKTIEQYTKVTCPWGCSFEEVTPPLALQRTNFVVFKTFLLPDGHTLYIYKNTHDTAIIYGN